MRPRLHYCFALFCFSSSVGTSSLFSLLFSEPPTFAGAKSHWTCALVFLSERGVAFATVRLKWIQVGKSRSFAFETWFSPFIARQFPRGQNFLRQLANQANPVHDSDNRMKAIANQKTLNEAIVADP